MIFKKPTEIIITILHKVINNIGPDTDFVWSNFDDFNDAKSKLNRLIDQLVKGNDDVLSEVSLFFAPTGCLQELSLSNGWGTKYMEYAEIIDKQIEKLNKNRNKAL